MKEKNKACMFIFLVMGHDKDSFLVACNVLYHCLMFNDIKNNKNKNLNYHILYILAQEQGRTLGWARVGQPTLAYLKKIGSKNNNNNTETYTVQDCLKQQQLYHICLYILCNSFTYQSITSLEAAKVNNKVSNFFFCFFFFPDNCILQQFARNK